MVEQGCLLVLCHLVDKFGVDDLIKHRFIERWLVKEPWGSNDIERQLNFIQSIAKERRLNDILTPIFKNPAARKRLVNAKLIPQELFTEDRAARDVRMINGEGTAGEEIDSVFFESRRMREQTTTADDLLRRRHREAMVLNDGTRPLERGDIIERER